MKRYLQLFSVACAGALLAACSSGPVMAPVSFKPSFQANEVWDAGSGDGTNADYVKLYPATWGKEVVVANNSGSIKAYSMSSGDKLWEHDTKHTITAGPTVAKAGIVYVGTGNGQVLALRATDGHRLWSENVSSEVLARPAISGSRLLVKTIDGKVTALNAKTGKTLWQYSTQNMPDLILRDSAEPGVSDTGYVVCGFANGSLANLTLDKGKQVWTHQLAAAQGATAIERMVDIDAMPIVSDNNVYAGSYQGILSDLALDTGQVIWQRKFSVYQNMALVDNVLVATDADSDIWAIDTNTGTTVWHQNLLKGHQLTGPAIMGQMVVVGDGAGKLYWLSLSDGQLLAQASLDDTPIRVSPSVHNGVVYALSSGGELGAFVLKKS